MPRRPARVTQAEIARAARVAKDLGEGWAVEICPEDGIIRIIHTTHNPELNGNQTPAEPHKEIVI
jgi:hypothetical protein